MKKKSRLKRAEILYSLSQAVRRTAPLTPAAAAAA